MSKAKKLLEMLEGLNEKASINGAIEAFKDNFEKLGDGNKAMKSALNVASDDGYDVDDAFTELASMKDLVELTKKSPWDEAEIKKFISKRFG